MPSWAGNPITLLVFFVVATAILFLLLRRMRLNQRSRWRWVDLSIVLLGGVGLIIVATDAERSIAGIKRDLLRPRVNGAIAPLRIYAEGASLYNCVPGIRTEFSPKEFDQIEIERKIVCDWVQTFRRYLRSIDVEKVPEIDLSDIGGFPDVTFKLLVSERKEFYDDLKKYNSFRKEYIDILQDAESRTARILLAIFAPFLISLAISLSIVKVFYAPR